MKYKLYQIDAFADKLFEGNPAAVVPLDKWLPDTLLQNIAMENNLSETVYFVPTKNGYHIRWFTPNKEVALCGHATLAAAYVIQNIIGHDADEIVFHSLSGELTATSSDKGITLNFPVNRAATCTAPDQLIAGLGKEPVACFKSDDFLVVFERAEDVISLEPNHLLLSEIDTRGIIVTAPSDEYDFIARFFAPRYGIPEDRVTGSAYTVLTPYWSERLNKSTFKARQVSKRGGDVHCQLKGDRVLISGKAVKFMEADFEL